MAQGKDAELSPEVIAHYSMAVSEAEKIQSYVERGRPQKHLSDERLRLLHAESFRAFVRNVSDFDLRLATNDLAAEHTIRGLEIDFSNLKEEIENFTQQVSKVYKTMTSEQREEAAESMTADYVNAKRRGS